MRKVLLMIWGLFFGLVFIQAQTVDTISVHSLSMNKDIRNVVVLPSSYQTNSDFPVVYLLHGYSGNHRTWLEISPELPQLANQYGVIIVCPDGKASWYLDSPINKESTYETFIAKELVEYIDGHYKTINQKNARAITGFSMGGYGALWLAIQHQDVFGACGATSGGVDLCPFPNKWEIKSILGDYAENHRRWEEHSIQSQLHLIKPSLSILFDCGSEDFFADANKRLHEKMLQMNIKHDYISRPGIHDIRYWNNSIAYHLLFFSNYFKGKHTYEKQFIYYKLEFVNENL